MPANLNLSNGASKYSINLLQAELLPERVLLTLNRIAIVWAVVLFVMVGWAVATHYTQQSLKVKLAIIQQENNSHNKQIKALTKQLKARKVDPKLADKLATIKLLMNNKKALHAKLTNPNITYVAGFAAAMNELAQLHHADIRLEKININHENMTFSGLALSPEAVPAWLAGFENSLLLSGKSFSHFKLSENEQNITEFTVSSKVGGVSAHE